MSQILIFGDSITWGAWDIESGGWVQLFKNSINQKILASNFQTYHEIYNLGVSGDNTDTLNKRIKSEIEVRLSDDEDTVIIIAIGINDSQVYFTDSRKQVEPEKFKKNIEKLIEVSHDFTTNILFIGPTLVDERLYNQNNDNLEKTYNNQVIKEYNQILLEVTTQKSVPFLNIIHESKDINFSNLLSDGLHPNTKGHQWLHKQISRFIQPVL